DQRRGGGDLVGRRGSGRLGQDAHGGRIDDAVAAGRASEQAAQRLVEGVGAVQRGAAVRPAGRGADQRDVGLDGQVDQGFGVGLGGYREAAACVGGLSPAGQREQAQSAEGRAQQSCPPGYGARSPSWLRRLIAPKRNVAAGG